MTQAISGVTTIRNAANPPNPLDTAIHTAGRKLLALQMTRFSATCRPDKGEAQSLVRDLLDVARIVDAALHDIGREARAHFGYGVKLDLFTDQMLGAIEGNATHTVCAVFEEREQDDGSDYYYEQRAVA